MRRLPVCRLAPPESRRWCILSHSAATSVCARPHLGLPSPAPATTPAYYAAEDGEDDKAANTGDYADEERLVVIDPGTKFLDDGRVLALTLPRC